jgi:hypothetical protein
MTPEEFESERRKSAEALQGVTEEARGADDVRSSENVLGPLEAPQLGPGSLPPTGDVRHWDPPAPPDLKPVNESWLAGGPAEGGALSSLLDGSRKKSREAQVRFNADQVQLDNALVTWVAAHFEATHRHYDGVIGTMQKRMDDIDTRHRELERELIRHVHEMARRIDVVLGEGEKGRVSHESALRSIRERLRALEEKIS